LLSGDLATLLFQHGSVTDADAAKIAMSMSAYAPAILLAPLVDVLSRVRYAHGDTTWPLAATALGLLANALVLVIAPILGLAAFGMGFTLNVLVMLVVLGSRERPLLRAFMPQASALGVSFGASGAAFVTYLLGRELGGHEGPVAVLAGLVLAGVAYLAVVVALVGPGILPRSIVHFGRGLLARRRLARASAGSRRPDG
jgi:peptidoglycan biosynthesis protein MviN/MurJ (putative lipid II flippase)